MMPALTPHQQLLSPSMSESPRNSTGSNGSMKEHLWVMEEDYEKPRKEMDFPSARGAKLPSRQKQRSTLRIDTYTNVPLQDRYLSSEEEPSPSPLDESRSYEDELKSESAEVFVDEDAFDDLIAEYKAEVAIAVPILAYGRPKLIDITNLAPMHKRKRTSISKGSLPHPTVRNPATRGTVTRDENTPIPVRDVVEVTVIPEKAMQPGQLKRRESSQLKRNDSFPIPAPESWLPTDGPLMTENEKTDRLDHDFSSPVSPDDYDVLSVRTSRIPRHRKINARYRLESAHGSSIAPAAPSLKGLSRSLSLVKRQNAQPTQSEKKAAKKVKMIPRGANEREDILIIPPFPFEDEVGVA